MTSSTPDAASEQPEIAHNQETERFELAQVPSAAYLDYHRDTGRLILTHTEVGDELEGKGVGSALVKEALAHADNENLTVVPECRFVAGWLDRHPDRAAELDIAAP